MSRFPTNATGLCSRYLGVHQRAEHNLCCWLLVCAFACLGSLSLVLTAPSAHAATFQVTNLANSGPGSLRGAIEAASFAPDSDTITFAAGLKGDLLVDGSLTISSNVSIVGPGASVLSLNGNHANRLLTITGGVVALSGLTLHNGFVKGDDGAPGKSVGNNPSNTNKYTTAGGRGGDVAGGAIYNTGSLTLTKVALNANAIQGGNGGRGGTSYFNSQPGRPGGSGGTAEGGAIYNDGRLKLVQASFNGNTAQGGSGGDGGEQLKGFDGSGELASGGVGGSAYGGAIYNLGPLAMTSTTFSGNKVIGGVGGHGLGGVHSGQRVDADVSDLKPVAQNITVTEAQNRPLSVQLVGNEFALTYSLVSGKLPAGLRLNGKTGIISGTPTTLVKGQKVTFKFNDGYRDSNIATITFNILALEPSSLVVTTLGDVVNNVDGQTSLREAVAFANTKKSLATVTFASGLQGTVTLESGALLLTGSVSIAGPQSGGITLDGNYQDRIFYIQSGNANISNLTLTNGSEGGLLNEGTLTLTGCAVISNVGGGGGGGLFNRPGCQATVANCTFAGNQDSSDVGGGAIYNAGTLTVDSSTLWSNTSWGHGGGIFNGGTLTLRNSLLAANTAPTGSDLSGRVSGGDYNLVQNATGASLAGAHNIIGKAPNLGPLQPNGGPTATFALLAGSPAIDAGQTALATDQRGAARPQGKAPDIGAFETPGASTKALPPSSSHSAFGSAAAS